MSIVSPDVGWRIGAVPGFIDQVDFCREPATMRRDVCRVWNRMIDEVAAWPPTRLASPRSYRFPAEVIGYAVWFYFQFPLSLRMFEEMLAPRGVAVSHETVRRWGPGFGREIADGIRDRRLARGD
ncbi:hypothetical protein N825_29460 [Skermanella stibiiresistens SB22]|uniref:Transposase n=1 Tax=Skermanella stibiiresistens SB22 TaxID=1385369 RepID=W9GQN6_9PROT|nr:hypothetical protein N825_29460 [Skermanella stibiiresistens SB22]